VKGAASPLSRLILDGAALHRCGICIVLNPASALGAARTDFSGGHFRAGAHSAQRSGT